MKYMRVQDDRGAKRRMAVPRNRWRDVLADRRRRELLAIQRELWLRSPLVRGVSAFLLLDLAAMFVMGLLITLGAMSRGDRASPQGEVPYAIGPMLMAMGGVVGGLCAWGIWRRHKRGPDHWRTWLDSCRCCPACEYDLAGLVPQSDDCLVCPECGGAWRLIHR